MADDEVEEGTEGRYRVESRSWHVAAVDPHVLSLREEDDGSSTRRIIDPMIIENPKNPKATVKITLHAQRRGRADGPWEDKPFSLGSLKAGEEVRIPLDSAETLRFYEHLTRLYEIGKEGVRMGANYVTVFDRDEVAIISGEAKAIVESLIESQGGRIFELIDSIRPDLLTAAALAKRHTEWSAALAEFETHVEAEDWNELAWQRFFEGNPWVFGHGLDYRFLVTAEAQPDYGGTAVTGRGGQRGDFLMGSAGDVRFAVLVEIKRPDSDLLGDEQYRNGAAQIGYELAGGVAQLQANCNRWEKEGSRTDANREWQAERGMATVQPRGILLIGKTAQLDTTAKLETFERFRRNLWNPEVLTYDELLERAKFLVGQAKPSASGELDADDGERAWGSML